MKKCEAEVKMKEGLHARPAAMLAIKASRFKASITVQKGAKRVDAKSVMALLLLSAPWGSKLSIEFEGEDEEAAWSEIESLFAANFGEKV